MSVSAAVGAKVMPVHRLDKAVSGVILYACHVASHRFLNTVFEERRAQKTYLALVAGKLTKTSGIIDAPIGILTGSTRRRSAGRVSASLLRRRLPHRGQPARGVIRAVESSAVEDETRACGTGG